MRTRTPLLFLAALAAAGCSPKDPPTATPQFKYGVPDNRSTVNSTDLYREPFYTQPGVNRGTPVALRPIPSQRGFEPNDSLAQDVYQNIVADGSIPTKYVTTAAKNGVVVLAGTVDTGASKLKALQIARRTPGVRQVRDELRALQ